MTASASVLQTTRTVSVEDVQNFTLGQRTDRTGPLVVIPEQGNVVAAFCIVGPSHTQQLLLTITGLNLRTATPAVVLLQPRQSVSQDFGFPDQFSVQVIDTSVTQLLVRIQRLDCGAGWGQELRLDIFIVDSMISP
jgi:hypothetical protein